MNVDFSKAPSWAIGHALHAFGGEIREAWVGEHQYQRLDQPKPFPYGGGNSDHRHNPRRSEFHFEQLRPALWTGEGLPPVGTVCETNVDGTWEESTVLAHHREMAIVFRYSLEHEAHMYDPVGESQVRLIRTPEQIAAEEREKAIAEMVYGGCGCDQSDGTTTAFVICRLLYDAGYRKQVSE